MAFEKEGGLMVKLKVHEARSGELVFRKNKYKRAAFPLLFALNLVLILGFC
jgi:hypothetical protein